MSQIRIHKTRVALGMFLVILLFRGFFHLLPNQLEGAPLEYIGNNAAHALYKYYRISEMLVQNPVGSWAFTLTLSGSALTLFLWPASTMAAFVFWISFWIYEVLFNVHLTHISHLISFLTLFSCVFLPRKEQHFSLLWEVMRLYICWAYGSAFAYKFINGAAYQNDFGVIAFKGNVAGYLLLNPETWRAAGYRFLYTHPSIINVGAKHFIKEQEQAHGAHPYIINIGAKLVFLMEWAFTPGFLTRKFDPLLLIFSVLIPACTFLFADTMFLEILPASFVFIPEKYWQKPSSKKAFSKQKNGA